MSDSKKSNKKGGSKKEEPKAPETTETQADENVDQDTAAQPANDPAPAQDDKKKKVIRFQLSPNKLMWNSPKNTIRLSAFRQEVGGEVSIKDSEDYAAVENAIRLNILIEVDEGEDFEQFKTKDLTAGRKEIEAAEKVKQSLNTEEYLMLRTEELIPKIQQIDNPNMVIKLIQEEKAGNNETKVVRQTVLDALRDRLVQVDGQGIFEYDGDL